MDATGLLKRVDLRHGRWQDVLADVHADHLIVDAPYSARTHGSIWDGSDGAKRNWLADSYAAWGVEQIREVCAWAKDHVRHWVVSLTDHVLFPLWEQELTAQGYYVFSPVILVETGRNVRLRGDGPACWATMIVVARPRSRECADWRALAGAYVVPRSADKMIGGKPLDAMRQIVQDYSNENDTIVDLCAGYGTTLLAAALLGRKAIGAEMDPQTYERARQRLRERLHSPLFDGAPEQIGLF